MGDLTAKLKYPLLPCRISLGQQPPAREPCGFFKNISKKKTRFYSFI
jgi:hypothetical protein